MEFLTEHVIPPTGHYLDLLQFLSVIMYLIHLPYVGIVIGATALSMWLTFRDHEIPDANFSRFAGEIIDTFLGRKLAMVVLGVFPLLTLPFIYAQWFAGLEATPSKYIPMAIPGIVVGLVLLSMYKSSYPARDTNLRTHMLFGTIGLLVLLGAYLLLMGAAARLHDPEKWFRVTSISVMLLNFNVIWKFFFFVHASLAITGGAILFFFFKWPRVTDVVAGDDEAGYAAFVRKFAGGLALAFTFSLPVWYLFYIFTAPDIVFDQSVYILAAALVFVAMITAMVLLSVISSPRPRFVTTTFTLFLVIFALMNVVDQKAMVNANMEHAALLTIEAEQQKAEREAEIEAIIAAAGGEDKGREVYEATCVQCHRFDERLVGPPLNDVLPAYEPDIEALMAFIANPTKRNPDYPPMPNPGLTPVEIKAVAEYVLSEMGKVPSPGEGQE
jgi:cytochrome c